MPRPTLRLLFSHPAHFLSLGMGSGLSAVAPGTAGSLLAWLLYYPLFDGLLVHAGNLAGGLFILAGFVAGCLFVPVTSRALGVADHGGIVWDEFIAVWLVLWLSPAQLVWQAASVAIFRFFDILKPWPIRIADARFKNGFGVMFDDLLAAGYTLLCILAIRAVVT